MDEISNKTDDLNKTLNKFITYDNLSPFINSPVKYRYRNNILFTIGYNINGKIEVGPLQKNKSVINSSENINASQLHIDICEILKDYIINHTQLKVYKYKKESGFWKHIHIKQNSKHDFITYFFDTLFLYMIKNKYILLSLYDTFLSLSLFL